MEVDEAENEWPAWNPAVFAADNGPGIPQHPMVPQDHLYLELSGASMRFLRGDGPELSLDDIFAANASDDGSSSSSDAPLPLRLKTVLALLLLKAVVQTSLCTTAMDSQEQPSSELLLMRAQ